LGGTFGETKPWANWLGEGGLGRDQSLKRKGFKKIINKRKKEKKKKKNKKKTTKEGEVKREGVMLEPYDPKGEDSNPAGETLDRETITSTRGGTGGGPS